MSSVSLQAGAASAEANKHCSGIPDGVLLAQEASPTTEHVPMGAVSMGDRQSAKGERLALKSRSPAAGSKKGRPESFTTPLR
jgi:hypothetical protein